MLKTGDAANGVDAIAVERERQVNREGFDAAHDDAHGLGEMVSAAMSYALYASFQSRRQTPPHELIAAKWPWEQAWWKPSDDPVRNLEKAGALIAAEIDRLRRARGLAVNYAESGVLEVGVDAQRQVVIQLPTFARWVAFSIQEAKVIARLIQVKAEEARLTP